MRDKNTLLRGADLWRWRTLAPAIVTLLIAALVVPLAAAAPAVQGTPVLRIGYIGVAGSEAANGARLAIAQINEFGGVTAPDGTAYQLELVALDTMPTVETLSGALETLLAQDVVALLGPDTNALITPDTIGALVATGLPVFTAATGDALTDVDVQNHLFRIRAPERVYSYAIATYLVDDLGLANIGVVQTEVEYTEAVMNFESALRSAGGTIVNRIQLPDGSQLEQQTQALLADRPQAVVMWGSYADAALLLELLRDAGWGGVFAYRHADEAARAGVLPDRLVNGVLGFTAWSYSTPTDATSIFVRDYVVTFGAIPGPLAVTSYDAIWFLRAAIRAGGVQPAALLRTLIELGPQSLVHGVMHPIEFANGDLTRLGVVYELGKYGGPTVVAKFDDTRRIGLEEAGGPEPPPTPTPQPEVPTPTLVGTWIEVVPNTLNVRIGPGFEYDRIGQISQGERFRVLGAIADYTWLVIDYQGGMGWVKSEFVVVLGDINAVAIVQPPASPTPGATATLPLPPGPDIVIDTVVLSPAQPIPNQPFTATVTVRNAGADAAGRFAVAATWEPGGVYSATFVEGLAGGQSTQVQLSATLVGTGVYQVVVIADLNNDVAENNEQNNTYTITYRADYPLLANQANIQMGPGVEWDLFGGTTDIFWDGFNLGVKPGATIGLLSGVTYENAHHDMLTPTVVNNTVGYGTTQAIAGAVFGVYTVEGQRAVLRIDNRQDQSIWISYRVYNSTP